MSAVSVHQSVCHAGPFDAAFAKSLWPLVIHWFIYFARYHVENSRIRSTPVVCMCPTFHSVTEIEICTGLCRYSIDTINVAIGAASTP